MLSRLRSRRGGVAGVTVVLMVVLCGGAALCIDVGQLYVAKQRAQNACDAAALAGVSAWPNETVMVSRGIDYANKNQLEEPEAIVGPDGKELTVSGHRTIRYTFGRVLGFTESDAPATATARLEPVSGYSGGLIPFGVILDKVGTITAGMPYTLKYTDWRDYSQDAPGNFGSLALGGKGGDAYRENIQYGCYGEYAIGDLCDMEPGNMRGPTTQGLDARLAESKYQNGSTAYTEWQADVAAGESPFDSRVVMVPLISPPDSGRSEEVKILGFAAFFIENVVSSGSDDKKITTVYGRFINLVVSGTGGGTGSIDTGVYTPRLIK